MRRQSSLMWAVEVSAAGDERPARLLMMVTAACFDRIGDRVRLSPPVPVTCEETLSCTVVVLLRTGRRACGPCSENQRSLGSHACVQIGVACCTWIFRVPAPRDDPTTQESDEEEAMAKSAQQDNRRVRAAQIQEQHRRAERRRSLLIIAPAVVVAVLLVGSAVFVMVGQQRNQAEVEAAARAPIEGVESFPDLSRNHVETAVDYPQSPPVGGDHAPIWTNCGAYEEPVEASQAVHSLEHGAVWIGYDPALGADQVEKLTGLAEANSYVVLSPVEDVPSPISVSAWGKQLQVDSVEDPRLAAFVQKYQQGPQTPEPGAACTGGAGGM